MTPDRAQPGGTGPERRDELIDALLDGDLAHDQSRVAYERLRRDPGACEELARLRYAVARLQNPVEAPDLSGAILGAVDVRRGFLPRRARRLVTVGRVAIAAGAVVTVGLASFLQRYVPELRLAEQSAPVTRMVETTERTAREQSQLVESTVEAIRASLAASPVARLSLGEGATPERRLNFEVGVPEIPPPSWLARAQEVPPPTPAAAAPLTFVGEAESPFIGRFGSLLVVLREPPPTIDEKKSAADDR